VAKPANPSNPRLCELIAMLGAENEIASYDTAVFARRAGENIARSMPDDDDFKRRPAGTRAERSSS
jgi:hypothetical protein